MAGPNKQFDEDKALDLALQLFWKKGYESTSMQELVGVMQVNRASLYQTYGNKYDLYLASLNRYVDTTLAAINQVLEETGPALASLQALFQRLVMFSLKGGLNGCFINNTAVELGAHDQDLAKKIRDVWRRFEDVFATMVQRGIDNGEIAANTDVRKTARLLNTNLQGLLVQTKINSSKKSLFDSVELIFSLIHK